MPEQQKHGKGGDPLLVHEDVAELFKRVGVLENMIFRIQLSNGQVLEGKLDLGADHCVMNPR